MDLRLVAECVDTSVDYLQEINPSLLRMTTPKDQPFTLNLPAGSQEKYETAIAVIPQEMRTYWRYHRVEYGDSLGTIARKYHVSTSSIADANSLSGGAGDDIRPGTKLIIPISPNRHEGAATPIRTRPLTTKFARAIPSLQWLTTSRFRSISCANGITYAEIPSFRVTFSSSTSRLVRVARKAPPPATVILPPEPKEATKLPLLQPIRPLRQPQSLLSTTK